MCTNSNEDLSRNVLKGIRIYPAEVTKKGGVIKLDDFREETRENCGLWHKAAECPEKEIAVSVKVHRGHDYITGLGLGCRPVRKN